MRVRWGGGEGSCGVQCAHAGCQAQSANCVHGHSHSPPPPAAHLQARGAGASARPSRAPVCGGSHLGRPLRPRSRDNGWRGGLGAQHAQRSGADDRTAGHPRRWHRARHRCRRSPRKVQVSCCCVGTEPVREAHLGWEGAVLARLPAASTAACTVVQAAAPSLTAVPPLLCYAATRA